MADQWARVRGRSAEEFGEVEYRTWLRQMTLAGIDGDEITVHLPTRFLRDWVRSRYGDRMNALWQAENPAIRRVDIRVGGAGADLRRWPKACRGAWQTAAVAPLADRAVRNAMRTALRNDCTLDPRFTFDAFVVGKPNEFAYACARRVAEQPSSPGFNPLFLYGGVGLGKTHLMHAIAWELVTRSKQRRNGRPSRRLHVGREVHVPLHRRDPQPVHHASSRNNCAASTC